jgi:hypothetical protein
MAGVDAATAEEMCEYESTRKWKLNGDRDMGSAKTRAWARRVETIRKPDRTRKLYGLDLDRKGKLPARKSKLVVRRAAGDHKDRSDGKRS